MKCFERQRTQKIGSFLFIACSECALCAFRGRGGGGGGLINGNNSHILPVDVANHCRTEATIAVSHNKCWFVRHASKTRVYREVLVSEYKDWFDNRLTGDLIGKNWKNSNELC